MKNERDLETEKNAKESALRAWNEKKIEIAKGWIGNEQTQRARKLKQGAVYMCTFGENIGAEINTELEEVRPVLVVSNDLINQTADNITIVPLTKHLKYRKNRKGQKVPMYKSQYFLWKNKYSFLTYDSAVKGEEVKTISKIRITTKMGNIDTDDLEKVLARLEWVFKGN
jgi:mRNA interferase MazF